MAFNSIRKVQKMALIWVPGHVEEAFPGPAIIMKNTSNTCRCELTHGLHSSLAQQLQYFLYEMPNEAFND